MKEVITITLFRLIKESFFHPEKLLLAVQLKRSKAVQLFLLLVLIASIPLVSRSLTILKMFSADAQIIAERLPEFTVQNGEITLGEGQPDEYMVRTETMILIVDTRDVTLTSGEAEEMADTVFSLALKADRLVLYTAGVPLEVTYEEAEGISEDLIYSILNDIAGSSWLSVLVVVLSSFVVSLFQTGLDLVILTLFANLVSTFMRLIQPFSANFKMIMVANVIPLLSLSLFNAVGLYPAYQSQILILLTLILYYISIRRLRKTLLK